MKTNSYLTDLKKQQGLLAKYLTSIGIEASEADLLNVLIQKLYAGEIMMIDQTYSPNSKNAQSGKAVAEAVAIEQKRSDNTFANALKGSKSGSAILIDDVSPVTREMGVKVKGKNLFDKSIPYEDYTSHGGGYRLLSIYVGSGSSVTVSLKQKHDIGLGGYFYCIAYKSSVPGASQEWLYSDSNTSLCAKSVTMISEDGYISLIMTDDAYNSFKDEIMVELGSTATAYTPYVPDLTTVKVSRYGKNLFDKNSTIDGYEITNVTTGDISVNKDWFVTDYILVVEGYTYKVSGKDRGTSVLFYDKDKKFLGYNANDGSGTFTVIKNACYVVLNGLLTQKETFQLELGSTATDYEPYIAPTEFTPTADGTVNDVTSLYPNTTLMTDTEGVIIDCEYNRDINKAFAALEAAIATNNS